MPLLSRRISSYHYQTFPTTPPTNRGPHQPQLGDEGYDANNVLSPQRSHSSTPGKPAASERPTKQLTTLAIISLCEQTALNSISPYLPTMASSFPDVDARQVGLYVGVIASSFAAAQFATNVFWGRISDRIGRKPVILLGTFLTALCFLAFGFCRTLWQAILVQAVTGLVNANTGIVSTVLGEITDKSNQSSSFSYLPIVYGIGGIAGPVLGGALVNTSTSGLFHKYPFLLPNIVSTLVLFVGLLLGVFMLEESLQEAQKLPALSERAKNFFTWLWQFMSSYRPSYLRNTDGSDDHRHSTGSHDASPQLFPETGPPVPYREIFNYQVVLLLITYTIFNLSNIAFNSLYPIYASGAPPTGRNLSPKEIGYSLGFSGGIAILFQGLLFTRIQQSLGNRWSYRLAFLGFVLVMFAMPFVGRIGSGKTILWIELGTALLVKTVATVGGLTCAMLLITNAAPKPSTLGTLNGLAQTLSAGGRAVGPLASGGLFTVGTGLKNGEFLAWFVFGGIALVGLVCSVTLRGGNLEGHEGRPLLDEEGGEREG